MKKEYVKPTILKAAAADALMTATSIPVVDTGEGGEEITDPSEQLSKQHGFWEDDEN